MIPRDRLTEIESKRNKEKDIARYDSEKDWLIQRVKRLTAGWDSLFETIKHGDEKHQAWLKETIETYIKTLEE